MLKVGIIGGAGYTAGELIRLIIHHPKVALNFVYSTSNAGNQISAIHQDLVGSLDMNFTDTITPDIDILFLCLAHGNSIAFLEKHTFHSKTKIIDLSNDFRLENNDKFKNKTFIYGLPELQKDQITNGQYIANPGCFATAIQLAILPLASKKLLNTELHINAVTGATGAGTSLSKTTHFSWRNNNFSHYKPFTHQHLPEIYQSIKKLQTNYNSEISFIPNRGNFSRGIFATTYLKFDGSIEYAKSIYREYYKDASFTFISDNNIHLKQIVNTNNCLIHLQKENGKLLITSVIDNLLKGAAGQAIQNMNLMYGFEETSGLKLKATYF